MTIHTDDLLTKQLRSNLNKLQQIERTRGNSKFPAILFNFTTTLNQHIEQFPNDKQELHDTFIGVKISGDRSRMSWTANFMIFSFALLLL